MLSISFFSSWGVRWLIGSVVGTFIPAKHCARIFKEQGTGGSIVMIASMSGAIANRVRPPLLFKCTI